MMDRREFCGLSVTAASAAWLSAELGRAQDLANPAPAVIDTNVSLFHWPFRRLPLDEIGLLSDKFRALGITQAWAGSFEGLLHRDLAGVNRRLVQVCRMRPEFVPIGTINLELPGWEEDLRCCLEDLEMPAIRLHPSYHGYALSDPRFRQLLERVTNLGRFVQLAVAMEDVRTQNPLMRVPDVDVAPLVDLLPQIAGVRVQLLNYRPAPPWIDKLARTPGLFFDTARVEGTDGVPSLVGRVPAGRVLLGTGAPLLIPEAALIRVHESQQLGEAELLAVYSGNAQSLLRRHNS